MRKVAVLGSTGSVGRQTLEVAATLKENMKITALTAWNNVKLLAQQARQFSPQMVVIGDKNKYRELKEELRNTSITVLAGDDAITEVARSADSGNMVVAAIVGVAGLLPTLAAVQAGKLVALANKETLVAAGYIVMAEAARSGSEILPLDSEHSAIWQCLKAGQRSEVQRLILTASGGPFWRWPRHRLQDIDVERALQHPNWAMGPKITVDSATLMNKGLEVLEARWLFDMPLSKINVLIHPESIVHSLVEFVDGAIIAQLGPADMRLPIQLALTYPQRLAADWPRLDLIDRALTFHAPDTDKFPCLALALGAAEAGGTMPAVLNAANEVAVNSFLTGQLSFQRIGYIVEKVMALHCPTPDAALADILAADGWARGVAIQLALKE